MSKLFKLVLSVILIAFLYIGVKSAVDTFKSMMYPLRYEQYIEKYSKQYNLDKYLIMAVIKTESNYVHDAHSGIARGLMQITDDTALWIADKLEIKFNTDDIENPDTNIKMGCYYLSYLINYYGNVDVALAAYNGGMGNVSKWLKDPKFSADGITLDYIPFCETRNYVRRVDRYKYIYTKLYKKT